jgi:hypothetical protein
MGVGGTELESVTSTMSTWEGIEASETISGLTATTQEVCTSVCTSTDEKTDVGAEIFELASAWPSLAKSVRDAVLNFIRQHAENQANAGVAGS